MSNHEAMTDGHPQRMPPPTTGGNGASIRTPQTAERDAEAARLRGRGLSYRAIARELGIDVHTAHDAVQRALKAIVEEPAAEVRALELERLDTMYDKVMGVLERRHVTVSQGRVVRLEDPETGEERPLEDDGPVLQAVDRLLKIQERRARLLGLDAVTRVSVDAENLGAEILGLIETLKPAP